MLQKKWKIILPILIILLLAVSFWYGGDIPNEKDKMSKTEQTEQIDKTETKEEIKSPTKEEKVEEQPKETESEPEKTEPKEDKTDTQNEQVKEQTDILKEPEITKPTETKEPQEPQNTEITDKQLSCTLIIKCNTILDNLSSLTPEKVDLVPQDGMIFKKQDVVFYEGESVFNVLLREMKVNKIHMEYTDTPLYNSAYIEGIANLYEFDCGELSGWLYRVNDWFPNYGSSRYTVENGDVIEFLYTCDLGQDVGSNLTVSEQYEG